MSKNGPLLVIVLSILWPLTCCQTATSTASQPDSTTLNRPARSPKFTVTTRPASLGAFALQSVATGLIRVPVQSKPSFRISGTINQIAVHNGMVVNAGQVMARLDDRDQRMALRQAQDQLAEVQVQLRSLIAEYGGQETDTASLKPNARAFVLTKSGYYRAQTALASALQQLDYTVLRAPYAGLVANLSAKPYNFITSYEPFCTLLSRVGMIAEFSVLESELKSLRLGQFVRVIPVSMPDRPYTGQVLEINPFVNGQGLVLVKATINHTDNRLFEGMNVRIIIEQRLPKQVIIPKSAVVERSGRKVVFTVENGLAKWHYVTITSENEKEVAIGDGLKVGEQVIVAGSLNLAHDAPVTVQKP